jgi:hypothetical protein
MTSLAEVELIRSMGEVDYNRNRMSAAVAWIESHPARFASLTARRFVDYWFPEEAYSFWVVTALAIPGAIWIAKRRLWTGAVLVAVLIVYPLVYYISPATPRYRYPILWITLLQAGYLLTAAVERFRRPVPSAS